MSNHNQTESPFAGPLSDCPNRPNCVCTQETRPAYFMPPLKFACSAERAIELVSQLLRKTPRVKFVEQRPNYLHATFTTLFARFVDDVEFLADAEAGLLHFRSASRLGYSDMGMNRKRMTKLTQQLLETNEFTSAD